MSDKPFQYACVDYNQPIGAVHIDEFGRSRTTPGLTIGTHYRETYVLHFITAGKGRFTYGDTTVALSRNQAFLMTPHVPYYYIPDETDPWEYYWICFDGEGARTLVVGAGIADEPPYFAYEPDDIIELKNFIDMYPYNLHTINVSDQLMALSRLFDVMARLSRRTSRSVPLSDPVLSAVAFMENNYFRSFDVTQLSAMLHISRPYFTQIFARETGMSPAAYLTRLRTDKAKLLMHDNPSLSVQEVARAVGYVNPARFSKSFQRVTGSTPQSWIKRHRKSQEV